MEEPSEVKKKCDEEADTTVTQICQVGCRLGDDGKLQACRSEPCICCKLVGADCKYEGRG